jgi:cysteine sulfinate desulfinase/cysteine desulfurase-like protein
VQASCGAACHTGGGVSAVLVASGRGGEVAARETIRLSVGRATSRGDIDRAVAALAEAVHMAPA